MTSFLIRVNQDGPNGCWLWRGGRTPSGYGTFSWRENGRVRGTPAHRRSFELFVGPIPDGYEIDHLCSNPPCVNPAHLEAVTRSENMRRAQAKPYSGKPRGRKPRTMCPNGHALISANVYVFHGRRLCRTCMYDRLGLLASSDS